MINNLGHVGMVSYHNHTFPGQAKPKPLTSSQCSVFILSPVSDSRCKNVPDPGIEPANSRTYARMDYYDCANLYKTSF